MTDTPRDAAATTPDAPKAATTMAARGGLITNKSMPDRVLALAFVDLHAKGHTTPQHNVAYDLLDAADQAVAALPRPASAFKRFDLNLYAFYAADMPDLWGANEGLMKVTVDTRDPQALDDNPATAAHVREFSVKDGAYAPGFLQRPVFRNVLFDEHVNLGFNLYEMDTDASVYYEKIKSVIEGVPEIQSLNVLNGIPYLGLATKLFDGIIKTFGKNPDDHLWGEVPLLELDPIAGGAFLRSGIYVLFERSYHDAAVTVESLHYQDGRLHGATLSNHLIFGVRLRDYTPR